MAVRNYFTTPHTHSSGEPWRWLSNNEVMVDGDYYDSGKPVGWRGKGYNGIGCRFRNGVDEGVIRRQSVDIAMDSLS